MKQTAVEWFMEQISEKFYLTEDAILMFEKAKAMEKEQIMSAFFQGDIFGADYYDGVNPTDENYYNEIFKTE